MSAPKTSQEKSPAKMTIPTSSSKRPALFDMTIPRSCSFWTTCDILSHLTIQVEHPAHKQKFGLFWQRLNHFLAKSLERTHGRFHSFVVAQDLSWRVSHNSAKKLANLRIENRKLRLMSRWNFDGEPEMLGAWWLGSFQEVKKNLHGSSNNEKRGRHNGNEGHNKHRRY